MRSRWLEMALKVGMILTLVHPSSVQAFYSGYSKGFYFKSDDEKFLMKVRLRGQIQGFSEWSDWHHEKAGFRIRRARLYFYGNAFHPELKYKVQITLEGKKSSLRDLFVEYPVIKYWMILKAGQFKVPYNREYLTSSSNLELIERSITNEYFWLGRDIGLSIRGGDPSGYFAYGVGVFSGEGKNAKPIDTRPLIAVRIVVGSKSTWQKGVWKMEQGAFKKGFMWNAGAGFVYANYKETAGLEERTDKSKFMDSVTRSVDFIQFSTDLKLSYYPLALEIEFNTAKVLKDPAPLCWGFRAQASTFIYKKKLQLAGRYSIVKLEEEKINEIALGWSWYISENHRFKIQNDYTYQWGDEALVENREFTGRLQFQFYL